MDTKTRKKLEALVWKHTHKDYRGSMGDFKNVLQYIPGKGTCLVNLKDMDVETLLNKLPKDQQDNFRAQYLT